MENFEKYASEIRTFTGLNVEVFDAHKCNYAPAISTIESEEEFHAGIDYAEKNDIPLVSERGTFNSTILIGCIELASKLENNEEISQGRAA